jgi:Flp pilus assembly pilin Flp
VVFGQIKLTFESGDLMSNWYSPSRVPDFIRDETAGISIEYAVIMLSMALFLTPSITHYTEFVRKLFANVGSLIK